MSANAPPRIETRNRLRYLRDLAEPVQSSWIQEIFHFQQLGIDPAGIAFGQFEATGIRPKLMPRLETSGIQLPPELFQESVLMRG